MSSNERPESVCSESRWKLWLITVQPRVCAAHVIAERSMLFAEWRLQSFACPCGLFGSTFLMIPCVWRACWLLEGVLEECAGGERGGGFCGALPGSPTVM